MLDIQTETLISLADAAKLLPGLRPGTRMNAGSVRRLAARGVPACGWKRSWPATGAAPWPTRCSDSSRGLLRVRTPRAGLHVQDTAQTRHRGRPQGPASQAWNPMVTSGLSS